jgi:hypothetical protein
MVSDCVAGTMGTKQLGNMRLARDDCELTQVELGGRVKIVRLTVLD